MTNTNIFYKIFLVSALFIALSVQGLSAKPALEGLREIKQPDGSVVNIRLYGDFHFHYALTEDGYPLISDDEDYYRFASMDSEGNPVPSEYIACNKDVRSEGVINFLNTIDKEKVLDSIIKKGPRRETAPGTRGPGLFSTRFPSKGKQKSLAILVEFNNQSFKLKDPVDYFTRMLNEEGFSDYESTGSARDYYLQNSQGVFDPEFDVYGPVLLDHTYSYYGGKNDANAYKMIIHACEALDDVIDFSQYDANNDGIIDNVYVFYAGYGEADSNDPATVWPHSWDISIADPKKEYIFDGKRLDHYACSNEWQNSSNLPDGIGTFCHEFCHVMGLPDLYSTIYTSAHTPGNWSILDQGSYLNHSRTPPNMSAFERYALDWITPVVIRKEGTYTLENIEDSNRAYMMKTGKENEYFLLENRQKKGQDTYLPYHGMLIWHIDFDQSVWNLNTVNNNAYHQYVDIIEADTKQMSRSGEPFPGAKHVTEFTCMTSPSFVSWNNEPVPFDLYDISESGDGIITFRAQGCSKSGVENIICEHDYNVMIKGNTVYSERGNVSVYDLNGRLIGNASQIGLTLGKGIYIVTDGNETEKIVIK